jgi:replicative DNA helicase
MVQSLDDARLRSSRQGPKVPPHDLDAEESLLGAMLLSRDAIAIGVEICNPDDFYKPSHGHVFEAITGLYAANEPADHITVADALRRVGLLDACGGEAFLVALQVRTPATSRAEAYARIVEEHALLRRLIGVAGEIADLGYSLPDDVTRAVDHAETLVFDVAQRRVSQSIVHLRDLLFEVQDALTIRADTGDAVTGVPTGFGDLDSQLSGLQPSNLVIVGARPGAGKTAFALGVAANAAVQANVPVAFFSLEMDRLEIASRLVSADARVDSSRMRSGRLHESDWHKIATSIGHLDAAPLYIDDNPMCTVMDIRAKARRLKSRERGLGLVIVDYLQLMSGRNNAETRQVEVSEISRGLKILARELEIPVMALSQLSRNLELRTDKRPMLADLRESGCVTADTRILRADTGAEVTIGELVETGATNVPVWSVDKELKVVKANLTHAFPSGVKEVFELKLASGRTVKASANHPFLKLEGWARLDELEVGSRIAIPRLTPEPLEPVSWPEAKIIMLAHLLGDGCFASRQPLHYTSADEANLRAVEGAAAHWGITPRRVSQKTWTHVYLPSPYRLTHGKRNPICHWLHQMGLNGLRSGEKFVPDEVFRLSDDQVALFLRHLWATDGSVQLNSEGTCTLYYASKSRRLAEDVMALLLRFGIVARLKPTQKSGYDVAYTVSVYGSENQLRFAKLVGCHGGRGKVLERAVPILQAKVQNTNVDTIPSAVWVDVRRSMRERGVTARRLAAALEMSYCGSALYKASPSRARLARVAEVVGDDALTRLAQSDVFWDRVVSIEALGPEPVFDATVEGTHNFVANGITVHNSLEQDADVVMFLHRPEMYEPDSTERGIAEVIVAKHRNGPTGLVKLAFLEQYTRFVNMARDSG